MAGSYAPVFNEYYSRRKLRREAQLHYKRSTGKPLQHKQPFGWQLSADKTQLEPNTAIFKETNRTFWELARELVEFYLAGNSLTALADHAARLGIPLQNRWLVPIHASWWSKSSPMSSQLPIHNHMLNLVEWAQIRSG